MNKMLKYFAYFLAALAVISLQNLALTGVSQAQDCLDYSEFYPETAPLMGGLLGCGSGESVSVHANTLYLATTAGLISFDNTDPTNPVFLGRTIKPAQNLAAAGSYAGVIDHHSDIQIIDVMDPSDLREVGSLAPPDNGEAEAIAARGDFLYVTVGPWYGRLCVVDISQPSSPVLVAQVPFFGDGWGIALKGDYAFVVGSLLDTDESGITVFDISNPLAPFQVDGIYLTGILVDIEIHGQYAYIADSESGILIADLANPEAIEIIGMVPGVGETRSLSREGDLLFASRPTPNYPEMELVVIDVQNTLAPQVVGRETYPHSCWNIAAVGQRVYLATGYDGMQVVDVSVPQSPIMTDWAGLPGLPGYVSTVALSGSTAFASYGRKVGAIDLSTPSEPEVIGTVAVATSIRALWPSGDFLFAGGTRELEGRFMVIDVTDPTEPNVVSQLDMAESVAGIAGLGSYVYATSLYHDLSVVDVSDPLDPRLHGMLDLNGECIQVVGNYAYVGSLDLSILDLADPGSPQILSSLRVDGSVSDIAVVGDLVLAASNFQGMSIIDIKDPMNPTFLSSIDTPSRASSVDYLWPYAYVTDLLGGMLIVDISDPNNPAIVGLADTPGRATDLAVNESFICLADNHHGFQVAWPACPNVASAPEPDLGPHRPLLTLDIYPNPFNPRTTISFECRESGPAQLAVFDLSGRRVVQLFEGWLQAGHHEHSWNGRDSGGRSIATGQYLVRLKTTDGVDVRKVILAK